MQGFSFVYKDAAVVFMVLFLQRRGWSEINKTEDFATEVLWNRGVTFQLLSLITEEMKHMNNMRCHM